MANSNGMAMLFNELPAGEGESNRDRQSTLFAREAMDTHSEECLQGHRGQSSPHPTPQFESL